MKGIKKPIQSPGTKEATLRRSSGVSTWKNVKPVGTPLDANLELLKLLDEEFENVQTEMKGIPYKAGVGSFMYAMVAKDRYCICSEYGELIHVEGHSTTLDGRKEHNKVFKRHFGFPIMPWRQGYCLLEDFAMRIGREMQMTGDQPWGMCLLLALESFCGNARNNQSSTLSTMDAKYMTTSHCMKEAVWFRQLLADVEYMQEEPTSIM